MLVQPKGAIEAVACAAGPLAARCTRSPAGCRLGQRCSAEAACHDVLILSPCIQLRVSSGACVAREDVCSRRCHLWLGSGRLGLSSPMQVDERPRGRCSRTRFRSGRTRCSPSTTSVWYRGECRSAGSASPRSASAEYTAASHDLSSQHAPRALCSPAAQQTREEEDSLRPPTNVARYSFGVLSAS
eukprot:5443015-Prymnesium_polylepis.3